METLLANLQTVLDDSRRVLDEVLSMDDLSRQAAKLQDQAMGMAQRIRKLVNENARTQMAEDEFNLEYEKLVGSMKSCPAESPP